MRRDRELGKEFSILVVFGITKFIASSELGKN